MSKSIDFSFIIHEHLGQSNSLKFQENDRNIIS